MSEKETQSEPPLSQSVPLPIPKYERLFGRAEASSAIEEVIGLATHSLRIFDTNLSDRGFGSPARIERLKNYLLSSRDNKIRVVLHDISQLEPSCARFMALFRQHPSAIVIHQTTEKAKHASDPIIIADSHSYWHLLHFEQPRSILQLRSEEETAPMIERFEQIWEASELGISSSTLGL
jgi:hypothetical protein